MSGYLARLVASVHRAPSPIHPVVAPLFAGQPKAAELPVIEEERITPPWRYREARDVRAASREPEVLRPATQSQAMPAAESHAANPASAAPVRPPLRSVSAAPDVAAGPSAPASQLAGVHRARSPIHPVETPISAGQPEAAELPVIEVSPAADSYTPLMIVNTIQKNVAPSSPAQNARPSSFAPVKQRPPSSSLPSARSAREPDEVQIHIGRIEVTAVAPLPSNRSPGKPARKSPSLDEYLKRGRR